MTEQTQFLEKVRKKSGLETLNEAQAATNVVFRIMRDMVTPDTSDRISEELRVEDPDADLEVKDLWKDNNPMVSFFSRLSPVQPLKFSEGIFMSRLRQEAALPNEANAQQVAQAVFSATKEELSQERVREISNVLPNEIQTLWKQA